jgi:hypothetical protein
MARRASLLTVRPLTTPSCARTCSVFIARAIGFRALPTSFLASSHWERTAASALGCGTAAILASPLSKILFERLTFATAVRIRPVSMSSASPWFAFLTAFCWTLQIGSTCATYSARVGSPQASPGSATNRKSAAGVARTRRLRGRGTTLILKPEAGQLTVDVPRGARSPLWTKSSSSLVGRPCRCPTRWLVIARLHSLVSLTPALPVRPGRRQRLSGS